ncbi:phasin family protein [Aquincola sp. S2]|uniref:Phasin family protein n=1 Tax=Pseudaquabacterium terrae TaxID=2732868 RepID=A0ABX2ES45_9BURK|nr:phasin family protein [Aquabacterium terrae]NRF71451.1 phasin family protein [Aquabacterium terrae]
MVKKLQKMADKKAASPAGLLDSQLANTIKASAQQIWLAGLGAFAKAQGEGTKVFETLMKEGQSLHRKTQAVASEKLGDVAGKMSAMAGEVGGKANAQWDKLETIFEERTARAMNKLGVPTAKDVAALTERVDALAAAVAKLGGKVEAPKAARAPKAAAKAPRAARKAAAPEANGVTKPAAKRRVARKAAATTAAAE